MHDHPRPDSHSGEPSLESEPDPDGAAASAELRSAADLAPDDAAAISRPTLTGLDRSLVLAIAASLLAHLAFVVVAYSVRVPEVRLDIDVRASRGVALMSRVGFAPPSEQQEDEFVEVEHPDEGSGAEASAETGTEPADSESDGAEPDRTDPEDPELAGGPGAETGEPEDQSPDDTEGEPIAIAPIPTQPTLRDPAVVRPPSDRPERPQNPGARPDAGEGSGAPDPASLPPSRRYPEGTVNPVATDVGMWGPEGAASVAVVRTDRIRNSEHRATLETIFGGLGDYADLSRRTNISILDDVDAMLLASTDVSNAQKTFVAAVHRLDPGYLMSELRRGYPSGVNWEERGGRFFGTPGAADVLRRRFVIPTQQLLVFSPQEFLDPLLDGAPRPNGLEGALVGVENRLEPPPSLDEILVRMGLPAERPQPYTTDGDPCDDRRGVGVTRCRERVRERRDEANAAIATWEAQRAELLPAAEAEHQQLRQAYEAARRNGLRNRADREPPVRADESWITGLLEVGDLAGPGDDGPAMLWTFNGFDSFGLGGLRRGTAPPSSLHVALTLNHDPLLAARFRFETREQAEDFRDQWGAVVDYYTFPLTAAGLLRAFRNGEWEIDHDEAIVTITVPAGSMSRMAAAMALLGGG